MGPGCVRLKPDSTERGEHPHIKGKKRKYHIKSKGSGGRPIQLGAERQEWTGLSPRMGGLVHRVGLSCTPTVYKHWAGCWHAAENKREPVHPPRHKALTTVICLQMKPRFQAQIEDSGRPRETQRKAPPMRKLRLRPSGSQVLSPVPLAHELLAPDA